MSRYFYFEIEILIAKGNNFREVNQLLDYIKANFDGINSVKVEFITYNNNTSCHLGYLLGFNIPDNLFFDFVKFWDKTAKTHEHLTKVYMYVVKELTAYDSNDNEIAV